MIKTNFDSLLIIFNKNPVKGKVKTRLAKKIGDDRALQIYQMLLYYTETIVCTLKFSDKAVFYSDFISKNDMWENSIYQKGLQKGNDLGERMRNAFSYAFKNKYKKAVIIGTDCYELKTEIIEEAFNALENFDVVAGPAKDGGYYLLGMKKLHEQFFVNKQWSSENVLLDTVLDMQHAGLSYKLLRSLADVDEEKDLLKSGIKI